MRTRVEFRQHTDIVRRGWFGEPEPVTTYWAIAVRTDKFAQPLCSGDTIWDSGPCQSREEAVRRFYATGLGMI